MWDIARTGEVFDIGALLELFKSNRCSQLIIYFFARIIAAAQAATKTANDDQLLKFNYITISIEFVFFSKQCHIKHN